MPVTQTKNSQCRTGSGKPKTRFGIRQEAARHRDKMIDSGRVAPGTFGAFSCDHCGGFHTGHRRIDAATRGGQRGRKNGRRR